MSGIVFLVPYTYQFPQSFLDQTQLFVLVLFHEFLALLEKTLVCHRLSSICFTAVASLSFETTKGFYRIYDYHLNLYSIVCKMFMFEIDSTHHPKLNSYELIFKISRKISITSPFTLKSPYQNLSFLYNPSQQAQ